MALVQKSQEETYRIKDETRMKTIKEKTEPNYSSYNQKLKFKYNGQEKAQWLKACATKPHNLSQVSDHMVEGESQLPQFATWAPHMHHGTIPHPQDKNK